MPPSPAQAVDESVRVWFPSSIIIIEYGWNCELAVPKFVMEKAHEVVLGPTTEHMAEETVTSGFCVFDPRRPKKYEPTGTVDTIATTRRKISATAGETALLFNISRSRVRRGQICRFEPKLQRACSRTQDSGWAVGCDW